jgi:hypothetical protein
LRGKKGGNNEVKEQKEGEKERDALRDRHRERYIERSMKIEAGNTKGGSITVLLTSCLTGLD